MRKNVFWKLASRMLELSPTQAMTYMSLTDCFRPIRFLYITAYAVRASFHKSIFNGLSINYIEVKNRSE